MGSEYSELSTAETAGIDISRWVRRETLERLALVAIVGLAIALRSGNLSALGFANHYYAAAVKSMLQSWHNFFFAAAEPGGAVSVDKPPVGLWIETASALVFGVNGFGLLLPELLAGVISVIVLYHLVRQPFGTPAGLLAGLALAITPVVVATDRNNTMDSTLILTLLLAAWAFIKAAQSARFWHLLLGAILVGIAFNIKMLEAYLPLPAFYALYLPFDTRPADGRARRHRRDRAVGDPQSAPVAGNCDAPRCRGGDVVAPVCDGAGICGHRLVDANRGRVRRRAHPDGGRRREPPAE